MIRRSYLFIIDSEPGKTDGKLRFRIRYEGNVVAFNVGYRVERTKWDAAAQRCRNNTTHGKNKTPASVINAEISLYETTANKVFAKYENTGITPETAAFRDDFNRALKRDAKSVRPRGAFFDVFDEFVSMSVINRSWSTRTQQKFAGLRNLLLRLSPDVKFSDIDEQYMNNLVEYLLIRDYRNVTILKFVENMRSFLRWAADRNYYEGSEHEHYHPRLKGIDPASREVIYLEVEELMHLYSIDLPPTLARVRDVFCFCCFTGLRYSDVSALKRTDIVAGSIRIVTEKTAEALTIELNQYARAILEKYIDASLPGGAALPVLSNQKMNDYLKEVGKIAGLTSPVTKTYYVGNERRGQVYEKWQVLTTHCARRTFVVSALSLGIPAEVVMRWTGHSDFEAMKPYVKITERLKEREMKKFDNLVLGQKIGD
jgi:integrase